MDKSLQRRRGLIEGVESLWKHWTFAISMIAVVVILARYVEARWVPLSGFAAAAVIFRFDRRNRRSKSPVCYQLPYIISIGLFYASVLTIIVLLMHSGDGKYEPNGQPVNHTMPFPVILTIAPVMVLTSAFYRYRPGVSGYCRICIASNGNTVDRGFIGAVYNRESRFQIRLLLIVSATLTVTSYIYYFVRYVNVNVNAADNFFLTWLPAISLGLSVIFLGSRYFNMAAEMARNPQVSQLISQKGTTLRFLVVCGDKVLLTPPSSDSDSIVPDDQRIDLSYKIKIGYKEKVTLDEAKSLFAEQSGISDAYIRYIYESHDYSMYNNVFHYIAVISEEDKTALKATDEWFTLKQVKEMSDASLVAPSLVSMLKRVYAITLAWKTFDKDGRRLYEIKHYRPTFRLSDLPKWDVDYTDDNWISISILNRDKSFYPIRKFWKKYIKGYKI